MSSGSYSSQVSQQQQNTYTTTNTSTDLSGATIGLTGQNFVDVAQGVGQELQYAQATNAALAAIASGQTGQQQNANDILLIAGLGIAAILVIVFVGKG